MLFTMWLAGNRHNASRCNRDKARRQDCSGRTLVLLPHKHRLVFSLSRNGIRGGKSAMVCQSASRISGPNQSQKADVGSWVNCQIIAARSCNVHPVKVRLAIHHVSHVAAFTEELHSFLRVPSSPIAISCWDSVPALGKSKIHPLQSAFRRCLDRIFLRSAEREKAGPSGNECSGWQSLASTAGC